MTSGMAIPTATAAASTPILAISKISKGGNMTPPMLAPLNAKPMAFGRSRSNHGATIALIAAPLVAAQPLPEIAAATNNCHGADATDQATIPAPARTAPMIVVCANPIDL
jgi:hypothetical protein